MCIRDRDSILGVWPVSVEIEFCLAQQERFLDLGETHPELKPIMLNKYMSQFWTMRGNFLKPDCEGAKQCGKRIKHEITPFIKSVTRDHPNAARLNWIKNISLSFYLKAPLLYRKMYLLLKPHKK